MLSLKLSKAALAIQAAPTPAARQHRVEELQSVVKLWELSHLGLQRGDAELGLPGSNTETVALMFAEIAPHYESMPGSLQPVNPSVDLKVLVSLREELYQEGESDALTEMIDLFLHSTPSLLESIREKAVRGSAEEVRHAAHSLRGSCGNFGIVGMAKLCAAIETEARAGSLQETAELVAQLDQEFVRVKEVLVSLRL